MNFDKHIFICTNERDIDNPKRSCGKDGLELRLEFQKELKKHGLNIRVRANKSGCLAFCSLGPIVVIYPAGVWYSGVKSSDVAEIIEVSVVGDGIVSRLNFSKEKNITK